MISPFLPNFDIQHFIVYFYFTWSEGVPENISGRVCKKIFKKYIGLGVSKVLSEALNLIFGEKKFI